MTLGYVPATELIRGWRHDLDAGTPPTLYPVAEPDNPLARIEIGPGLVSLFGGPPGAGKTALAMQLVVDALRLTPALKVLVANVEMPPEALFDRQFSRLSGIDLHTVRHRKLTAEHADRIARGMATLEGIAPRLAFLRPPWTVENLANSADAFQAELIVMDYVQRFTPPGEHLQKKSSVDAVMDYARRMADCGAALVIVAAVGRQRDEKGRSGYGGLSLASFRESSELEYGADDAFLLVRDDPDEAARVTLKHAKSRHGEPLDIPLRFNGSLQRFEPDLDAADGGKLAHAVNDLKKTRAGQGEEDQW